MILFWEREEEGEEEGEEEKKKKVEEEEEEKKGRVDMHPPILEIKWVDNDEPRLVRAHTV
ncbi:unnamed protein product [Hydatigera taeniaeformis]|uniref:Uncharacterized protein n=1 Tax=Hydatigena taeniaeformis TaxID=6205 RepID=A0A0R3WSA0_HYDTA|nr:unnamed protein product [Hydatigera taeniaeformis]